MKKIDLWKLVALAGISLAMALMVGCSGDDGGDSISYGSLSYGGKNYKTVVIGTQTWMAENLNYDVPNNDTDVCYDNDHSYCAKYGRLYDWETAKKVCPSGWHLPSNDEWTTLVDFAGGASSAGSKLKATSDWNDIGNGTDEYGFSSLPGGLGFSNGYFYSVGQDGYWWSASEDNSDYAYSRYMYYNYEDAFITSCNKTNLHSVRCLKD